MVEGQQTEQEFQKEVQRKKLKRETERLQERKQGQEETFETKVAVMKKKRIKKHERKDRFFE